MGDVTKVSLECSLRLSELLEFTCSPEFKDEMVVAREIFTLLSGKVNDDDFGYEQRMQLFQEFFLFEHRLCDPNPGYTIFELFIERALVTKTLEDIQSFENLRSAYRSLFVVERILGDEVEVHDLLGGPSRTVHPLCSFSLGGLPQGQIFEGRIICYEGHSFFTGAFIFHAPAVKSLVLRVARAFLARNEKPEGALREDDEGRWGDFLKLRFTVLRGLQNKRDAVEKITKKKAVEQLALARSFADIYKMVSRPDRVTAIGSSERVSCFVPEHPVVQRAALLNALALCEVRYIRYRHIEPEKVYAQVLASDAEGIWMGSSERARGTSSGRSDDQPSMQAMA